METPEITEETTETSTVETPQEEVKEELTKETQETKKDEKEVTPTEETIIEEIEKGEDGKFFLKAGDSTYYGSTKSEVIKNLLKGKIEQDIFIRETKVGEKLKASTVVKEKEEEVEIPTPNRNEIFAKYVTSEAKKQGIPIEMFSFKDADWDRYGEENNVKEWRVAQLYNKVEAIRNQSVTRTDEEIAQVDIAYTNKTILDQETPKVRKLIAQSGVNPDELDYKAIFDSADKNKDKYGIYSSGSLVEEAHRQIVELLGKKYKSSSKIEKDVQDAIKNGEKLKSKIKDTSNGGKQAETKMPVFKTQDELNEYLKKGIRAGTIQ